MADLECIRARRDAQLCLAPNGKVGGPKAKERKMRLCAKDFEAMRECLNVRTNGTHFNCWNFKAWFEWLKLGSIFVLVADEITHLHTHRDASHLVDRGGLRTIELPMPKSMAVPSRT